MVSICQSRVLIVQEEERASLQELVSLYCRCFHAFVTSLFYYHIQPLTSSELWQIIKQHYGHDLGLSHEDMERLQLSAEPSMQTR